MEFFKFKLNNESYEKNGTLEKMINAINLEGKNSFQLTYSLDKIDDILICHLAVSDSSDVKKVLTRLPLIINRINKIPSPLIFDFMWGYKCIPGIYSTPMCMWLCGYIRKDVVDKHSIAGAQNIINENAKNYFEYYGKAATTFVINDNQYRINNQLYYPVTFYLSPKTNKCKMMSLVYYTQSLQSVCTCFNKSAYDSFTKTFPNSIYKTDICGNKKLLNLNNKRYEDLPFEKQDDNNDMQDLTNKMLGIVSKK